MDQVVKNWNDIADDLLEDGYTLPETIALVARTFRLFNGLLTKALIESGKIAPDTKALSMDECAFVE